MGFSRQEIHDFTMGLLDTLTEMSRDDFEGRLSAAQLYALLDSTVPLYCQTLVLDRDDDRMRLESFLIRNFMHNPHWDTQMLEHLDKDPNAFLYPIACAEPRLMSPLEQEGLKDRQNGLSSRAKKYSTISEQLEYRRGYNHGPERFRIY